MSARDAHHNSHYHIYIWLPSMLVFLFELVFCHCLPFPRKVCTGETTHTPPRGEMEGQATGGSACGSRENVLPSFLFLLLLFSFPTGSSAVTDIVQVAEFSSCHVAHCLHSSQQVQAQQKPVEVVGRATSHQSACSVWKKQKVVKVHKFYHAMPSRVKLTKPACHKRWNQLHQPTCYSTCTDAHAASAYM